MVEVFKSRAYPQQPNWLITFWAVSISAEGLLLEGQDIFRAESDSDADFQRGQHAVTAPPVDGHPGFTPPAAKVAGGQQFAVRL